MRKKITGANYKKIIAYDEQGNEYQLNDVELNISTRTDNQTFKKFFYGKEHFYKTKKPFYIYEKEAAVNIDKLGKEFQTLIMLMPKIDRFNRTLLTIEEFAEEIGTTRQTMSKILHKLEESNLICLRPPKMIIINPYIFNSGSITTMEAAKHYWHESLRKKQGKTKSIRKSLD